MVSTEVYAILLSGLSISISILYYAMVLRRSEKARMTQVALNLSNILISPETTKNANQLLSTKWDDFEDFRRKYDSTVNPEHYAIRWNIWRLYEHLGYMLHLSLIEVETIYALMGGYNILLMWEKYEPIIMEQRKY